MDADPLDEAAFEKFVARRKVDLEHIRRGTRNEHEFPDVTNEAWLLTCELRARKGVAVNFLRSFQDLLISHLYRGDDFGCGVLRHNCHSIAGDSLQ